MEKLVVAIVSPIVGLCISTMVMPSVVFPMAANTAAWMSASSGAIAVV